MKKFILYKENKSGVNLYLRKNKTFTFDEDKAEVRETKWWVYVLEIILLIIKEFGKNSNIKYKILTK